MKSRFFVLLFVCVSAFTSCDDDNDFPQPEITLFDKTWVSSNGVDSKRYRLNSDGTYNGGTDAGFPNQGVWNWVDDNEEVMRISYGSTVIWYRFEDLTSISNTTFESEVQPYVWDDGTAYSLSN